jgi:hypothetical protein
MEKKIENKGKQAAVEMLRLKPRYKPKKKQNGLVGGFRSSMKN